MFDDDDGRGPRRIEFRDAFEGRIGIIDVVVRELLALNLARRCDARPLLAGEIEARGLMRVFAVAHRLGELSAEGA